MYPSVDHRQQAENSPPHPPPPHVVLMRLRVNQTVPHRTTPLLSSSSGVFFPFRVHHQLDIKCLGLQTMMHIIVTRLSTTHPLFFPRVSGLCFPHTHTHTGGPSTKLSGETLEESWNPAEKETVCAKNQSIDKTTTAPLGLECDFGCVMAPQRRKSWPATRTARRRNVLGGVDETTTAGWQEVCVLKVPMDLSWYPGRLPSKVPR